MEEVKARFEVVYSEEADRFLHRLPLKVRSKIIYNILKARYVLDPELFKKLEGSDIWEFRTMYNRTYYRMLAFWDKSGNTDTLVIATHGFVKKSDKTSPAEIKKANTIKNEYFKNTGKL